MMRVSKTLICAFVARASLAVRQNLKVDKSGASGNVLEQIGALIQAKGKSAVQSKAIDNLRMLAAITPEAKSSLDAALKALLTELEGNVVNKIKDGLVDTQKMVESTIAAVQTAHEVALTAKTTAVTADTAWSTCVEELKSMRGTFELAEAAEASAETAKIAPCLLQENSKMFEYDSTTVGPLSSDPQFECDFSSGDACTTGGAAFASAVEVMLAKVTEDAGTATKAWGDAKKNCDSATETLTNKISDRISAKTAWDNQKSSCFQLNEDRLQDMCSFGTKLQDKCAKVEVYRQFIMDVKTVNGGDHSEPDRAAEWETTGVTKCVLNLIIGGSDINADQLANCAVEVDYVKDVIPPLDMKETTMDGLTSGSEFTCAEEQITFSDVNWAQPTGTPFDSEDYIKTTPYKLGFSVASNTQAFSFCS